MFNPFKRSVCEKCKGVKAYGEKQALLIATNLTSFCCVYKEKSVKKRLIPKNLASIQIQKVETFNSDRKKSA